MSSPEDRKEDRIYRKVSQRLRSLNWSGPHCVGQLGILKTLDAVVEGTDDDNANKIDVTLALQDHAMRALPKNTAEVLRISNGESGLALELVRRDLTEFSVLVRVLYASTEDQRAADDGLHRIHKALSPVVELHGALVSAGVDVEQRAWARSLALQLPNLRRLRSTPWHEVALVLKLIVLETEDDEGGEAEDGENSTTDTNVYDPTVRPECCAFLVRIDQTTASWGKANIDWFEPMNSSRVRIMSATALPSGACELTLKSPWWRYDPWFVYE